MYHCESCGVHVPADYPWWSKVDTPSNTDVSPSIRLLCEECGRYAMHFNRRAQRVPEGGPNGKAK